MVPVEAGELEHFTPDSLKNVAVPPVFLLRSADGREWRKFQFIMRSEGLEYHGKEAFREETLKALKHLWSEADYEPNAARLRNNWAMIDQEMQPPAPEAEAMAELTTRLAREWRPLAQMAADNMRYVEESMKIAISMFCVGWTGMDVGYGREDGRVPLAKLDEVEERLSAMEKEALAGKIEDVGAPGTAFVQLSNAAYSRLHLTETERKNSSSPPPAQQSRAGSTKRPSRKTAAARSKASASSKKAR